MDNRISFNLPSSVYLNGSIFRLELKVATPFLALNDTRTLGLPLSGIRLLG